MILFWLSSALLALAALAVLLRPLLARRGEGGVSRDALNAAVYRDQVRELAADLGAQTLAQADYKLARRELERRMLEDVKEHPSEGQRRAGRGVFVFSGIALPLLALGIYLATGNPGALDPAQPEAQGVGLPQIEAMVQRLSDRLAQNPEDVEGWKMLGKSYSVLRRFPEAVAAYSKAAIRAPRDPQLLADLADVLAVARGQSLKGEPEELVLRALQIDPKNLKALALAGSAAFERKNYRSAARYWERMLPLVAADSEDARTIQANVDEARALSGSKGAAKKDSTKKDSTKKDSAKKGVAGALQGIVNLSPKLAGKASPEDTLFIFARAAQGPPMPLAVLRKRVRDLPVAFSLDDSMAMSPAMKLSGHSRVIVGARISKSGNASPQPGDLQGLSAVVANNAIDIKITIDTELAAR
jgi:cytochrome c-type biogenesis protein CcmH